MASRPERDTKTGRDTASDLEQYGVWVKAEPQDVVEEPGTAELPDFGIPEESADLSDDSFLSEDEERLLGSFEEIGTEAGDAKAAGADEDFSVPEMEDLPPLEDFESAPKAPESRAAEPLADTIDISLEDLDSGIDLPSISPSAELDPDSIIGLDESVPAAKPAAAAKPAVAPKPAPAAPPPASFEEIEDVSAEFMDEVEAAPAAKQAAAPGAIVDVSADFLDDAEPEPASPGGAEEDFKPIDIDLHFDEAQAKSPTAHKELSGFEEVSDFDDLLAPAQEPAAAEPTAAEDFDDLAAVEEALGEEPAEPAPSRAEAPAAPAPSPQPRSADAAAIAAAALSNELLVKIAEELSSIRTELVTLKREFASMGAVPAERPAPALEVSEPELDEDKASGFFDEEEDETIALTGDELDNILNSADFTEEPPVEAEAPEGVDTLAEEPSLPGGEILDENLLPEDGDYSAVPEPAIEEIRLDDSEPLAFQEEAPQEESISLDLIEEGARPMTPAPEDTSYLEEPLAEEEALVSEDLAAPEPAALEENLSIDIDESPLEEPDLSDFDLAVEELEVQPSAAGEDAEEISLEDIALEHAAFQAPDDKAPAELEALAPIEEFEDRDFAEIELGVEEAAPEAEEVPAAEEELYAEEAPAEELVVEEPAVEAVAAFEPAPTDFSPHPDELPTSLDDSYFVGAEPIQEEPEAEAPVEEELDEVLLSSPGDFTEPEPEEPAEARPEAEPVVPALEAQPARAAAKAPDSLKDEIRSVLSYLDKLLESLPEEKIEEFARSEYFDTYKRLFEELGLV